MKRKLLNYFIAMSLLVSATPLTVQAKEIPVKTTTATKPAPMKSTTSSKTMTKPVPTKPTTTPPPTTTTSSTTTADSTSFESEHPPLSDATKQAIAAYKKDPSEANKAALLNAITVQYDWVIENKQKNYATYTSERDEKVNAYMAVILKGGMPPFLSITGDDKMVERQAVSDAITVYRTSPTEANKALVKKAVETYYDAFTTEQALHIEETIALKDSRIATTLEYFTSELFNPTVSNQEAVDEDSVLAEIICQYISVGAEIVPVNPEARVRERTYNASITTAQTNYFNNPKEENKTTLRNEIELAFDAAYDARLEEYAIAENKGVEGGDALFTQLLDPTFRTQQYEELTEQKNLYGRIDRIITFGSNTYGDWTPRMIEQSKELANLISIYEASPTDANKKAAEAKFDEIYAAMLELEKTHLDATQLMLDTYVDETLVELTTIN